jgi:MYXO-CTERM domain-containing protein
MHRPLAVLGFLLATYAAPAAAQPFSDLLAEASIAAQADPDTDVTLSVMATNVGPDDAADAALAFPMPPGLTFVSLTAPPSWSCSTPSVDTTGTVTCTLATFPASETAAFAIVMHVDAGAAAGTYFTSVVTLSTSTFDPTVENDAATAVVQTPPPPDADLFVTIEGPAGSNPDTDVSYLIGVHNPGSVAASTVTFTHQLPFAFVSLVQTSGPTLACSDAGQTITCTVASMPAGTSAMFTVVGHTPADAGDGTTFQSSVAVTSEYDINTENDNVPTLLCVQANSCLAGACNANTAVVCDAPNQCHDEGTCDTVTGACVAMPMTDGTACDDMNACTQTDTCESGACTSGTPLSCDDSNACSVDTCDVLTGCMNVGECLDGGIDDAGTDDAGTDDAGTDDAGTTGDAGGGSDASVIPGGGGGCSCVVGPTEASPTGAYLAFTLLALGAVSRRSRRR